MASKKENVISKDLMEKRINLLPDHIKRRRKSQKRSVYLLLLVGVLVASVSFYTVNIMNQTAKLQEATESASYRISLLKEQQSQQAVISVLEEKIAYKQELLSALKAQNESIVTILSMLDISLPTGVVYNSVSATNEAEIQITGVSENYEQVADFIHNLKKTNHFTNVFLDDANKVEYLYSSSNLSVTYYTYTITCSIGGETDEV